MSRPSSLAFARRGNAMARQGARAGTTPPMSPRPPPCPLHQHEHAAAFTSSPTTNRRQQHPYKTITEKPLFGKAIDVHTHLYLPGYMNLLRSRSEVPRVTHPPPGSPIEASERLLILPGEDVDATTASGRPIGREYWSIEEKLAFMDSHGKFEGR